MRRALLGVMGSLGLVLIGLATAAAAAPAASSISVSASPDPVTGRPITLAIAVNIDPAITLGTGWGAYLEPGGHGAACPSRQPAARSDPEPQPATHDGVLFRGGALPPAVSEQRQLVIAAAGSYLVCAYIDVEEPTGEGLLATSSTPFQVRRPRGTLSISGPRHMRLPGLTPREAVFRISYSNEFPGLHNLLLVSSGFGQSCGRNYLNSYHVFGHHPGHELSGQPFFRAYANGGRVTYRVSMPLPGTYVVCAFLGPSETVVNAQARWVIHVTA